MTDHVSHETLALLADGELAGDAARAVRRHLRECEQCSRELAGNVEFNRHMRALPSPRLRREFTQVVLSNLGIPRRPSFLDRCFEHFASIVAAFLVLVMGGSVGLMLTIADNAQGGTPGLTRVTAADKAWRWFEMRFGELEDLLADQLSRAPGGMAAKIAVMILLMVTAVSVVDWIIRQKESAKGL